MIELDGADPEKVNRLAWEQGSLPVRLAMLGLASARKGLNPIWWGYPPGVFIGYKWNNDSMRTLVVNLADYIRTLGYRVFLDVENLDANADAYCQIPHFITSLQECVFYLLLLTELSADMIDARKHKSSWIHDEYEHAVRLTNAGRLFIVPVLLEVNGMIESLSLQQVIDLTTNQRDFGRLSSVLTPDPIRLSETGITELANAVKQFDGLFLNEQWERSDDLLLATQEFEQTFDHQFRRMLLSIYTANQEGLEAVLNKLYPVYGENLVYHVHKGYCTAHSIPLRANRH